MNSHYNFDIDILDLHRIVDNWMNIYYVFTQRYINIK